MRIAGSVLALMALALPAAASVGMLSRGAAPSLIAVPVVSSNAHRPDAYGNYGGFKSTTPVPGGDSGRPIPRRPIPGRPVPYSIEDGRAPLGDRDRIKPPYPYQYYGDTSRGNYGCYRYARRGIDTNNRNWLARYRACVEEKASD